MPITKAAITDVPELNRLVNIAYRGEESKKGWTTEADLLGGIRINEETLLTYFGNDAISILKYTNDHGQILGSVYLEVKGPVLYLGMFSVSPALQGGGIGRALLAEAEVMAKASNCHKITMTVISSRQELIEWYERRGYTFTGETQPFEGDGLFGDIKQPIEFIVMEKAV
ncbi:ribosomal protein S18 acetylase RimI-like enzyme [Pedobacter cryoconitis]|uniref:Ribosomal protein S18 acetylase RimI-like enzyme n=1 Tax=Pedobacter cryoconitis TaxID=188932 RepID=A0A7W8ZJI5_9SPHI|nr:GNAT family N-acetyltransferase [Pedobacter cryoconitis]MBB5635171.1 ribosomal protein S18 acetylase RimI-like enzyme [Pedobacter cryoconitis]MBB6271646.1 ribosomal protein S18 acetylase RimI-like enzyme [Pedobacter cryoconitis]